MYPKFSHTLGGILGDILYWGMQRPYITEHGQIIKYLRNIQIHSYKILNINGHMSYTFSDIFILKNYNVILY